MKKKSPITDKTLRHYGQSLDERIDTLINEKAMSYLIVTAMFFILSVLEWLKYFRQSPPTPGTMTFFFPRCWCEFLSDTKALERGTATSART